MEIPESHVDLLEGETFAIVGTLMPDGAPQLTPVWVDHEGDEVLFNTATGRRKERNLRRDPKVGVCVLDPENPYRYLSIRGEVAEITTEGAVDHINELAQRYMGVEEYPALDDDDGDRVIVRIRPDHVVTSEG